MAGLVKSGPIAALVVLAGLGLSGCFDLSQKVTLDRSGAGHLQVAVAAEGLVGEALKSKSDTDLTGGNRARTTVSVVNDRAIFIRCRI
jgi:hypothetical protein